MKWNFKDPTAADFDQEPLTPQKQKAASRTFTIIALIIIIGFILIITIICK
jgi:hypothetical protein